MIYKHVALPSFPLK